MSMPPTHRLTFDVAVPHATVTVHLYDLGYPIRPAGIRVPVVVCTQRAAPGATALDTHLPQIEAQLAARTGGRYVGIPTIWFLWQEFGHGSPILVQHAPHAPPGSKIDPSDLDTLVGGPVPPP